MTRPPQSALTERMTERMLPQTAVLTLSTLNRSAWMVSPWSTHL